MFLEKHVISRVRRFSKKLINQLHSSLKCERIPKEEEWSSVLARYERIPKEEIFGNLKVSFDALAQEEKDVFLDIVCFFKGDNLERVKYKLHAHYGYEIEDHINVLIEKSLIKINEFNRLTLHDQIEDMGKEIVRLESPHQTGERSRLWSSKDIVEVLEENRGTSKIGIMMFPYSKDKIVVNWDGDAFKNMTNLRTLVIKSVDFSESPKHLPNSIRVLEWDDYPSECFPVDFFPKQLTIFKLTSKFYREEDFFKKNFKNIRSLILQGCRSLRSILDMSSLQNLEYFSCRYCHDLITFDDSIGLLGKLKFFTVTSCHKLTTIPSLKLPLLEELTLHGLSSIESLSPTLDESLDKLKILRVYFCKNIKTIPPLKLASLEKLYLSLLHGIESLSPMLDEPLDKLKILYITSCNGLKSFPPVVMLPSLEILDLSYCVCLESFPSITSRSMAKLKILRVSYCKKLRNIPASNWDSLDEFERYGCESLEFPTSD